MPILLMSRGYGYGRVPYAGWDIYVAMVTGEYHMRGFRVGPVFSLDMLCYHDNVVRSWIGYDIIVMMSYTGYVMLSWLCCTILFYVYPVICGFLAEPRLTGMWLTRRY